MAKKIYNVLYWSSFNEDLSQIIYYITYILKNKFAAEKLLDDVYKSIIDRSYNPESYEIYKSDKKRKYKWYKINIKNYSIFYIVRDNSMEISHILYNKRDFDSLI